MLRIDGLSLADHLPGIAHCSLTGLQQGDIAIEFRGSRPQASQRKPSSSLYGSPLSVNVSLSMPSSPNKERNFFRAAPFETHAEDGASGRV